MAAVVVLLLYLFVGLICAYVVLWDKSPLLRLWLGLSFGMLLFMWLPALAAFAVGFTLLGEMIALCVALLIGLAAVFFRWKHPRQARGLADADRGMLMAMVCFVLPLTVLSGYMQHTHTLRDVNGALHVGQATFGDLPMHTSIITSLRGQKLPAEYSILPGTPMGYPLITDATSTSLMVLGLPLRWSIILPGTLMSALVYMGYLLLAREMTQKTSAAVLAGVLLFFNGGLGFLYTFDLAGSDTSAIVAVFEGYYQTPANQPDLNLRWSNLIADLLLPQRTFLGGWTMLLPALYFAHNAFVRNERRMFLLVALFGAALPLVHTHSFLALALYSAGALGYAFFTMHRQARKPLLINTGLYLGIVLALALPQLLLFTLRQATNEGFIRLHFNWVNNTADGFVDFYPWFWLKNVGLPLIAMLCALLDCKRRHRMEMIGAALIFIVAELVLFQPLDYDNNKLFYVWYLLMLPAAADWCVALWNRVGRKRSTVFLAVLFLAGSTLSGTLSIARELISDYEVYTAQDVEVAEFIEENTDPDAMFISSTYHLNPVYALAGRRLVCGTDTYLHMHGLDYLGREWRVLSFYEDPLANLYLLTEYGVDYITVGWYERGYMYADEETLDSLFPVVFDNGRTRIYQVEDVESLILQDGLLETDRSWG